MSYLDDKKFMCKNYVKSLLEKKELILSIQNTLSNNSEQLTYKELANMLNISLGKFRYLVSNHKTLLSNIEEELQITYTIYSEFLSSKTSVEIADICYCSTSKVFSTLEKLQVETKNGGRSKRKNEITDKLLCIYSAYSQKTTTSHLPSPNKLTYHHLARLLGVSYNYAWQLCEENKIHLNKK